MQRGTVGFALGLVVGVGAGWLFAPAGPPSPEEQVQVSGSRGDAAAGAGAGSTDGASRARVRVDARRGARGSRGVRGTGTPSGFVPPDPDAKNDKKPTPVATPPTDESGTPAEALAALIAIGDGTASGAPQELANRLVQADVAVPWETVVALARRGYVLPASSCVQSWSESDLRRALELAADDAHPDADALRAIAVNAAAVLIGTAYPDAALTTTLASHSDPRLRGAAVQLGYGSDPPAFDLLIQLARDDPDVGVRQQALEFTAWAAAESGDPVWLERALPALERAARAGPLELRRTAIESLPDAGPGAAAVALDVLLEEGVDDDLVGYLLAAVVNGGRLGALLAAVRTPEQRRNVAWALTEVEVPDDVMLRNARAIGALAAGLDADASYDLYWSLISVGAADVVAAAAVSARLRDDVRRNALQVLLEQDEPADAVQAGLDAARSVLFGAAGATLRRRVVQELGDHDWSDRGPGVEEAVREMLDTVAKNDPNAWVRGTAVEVLSYWDE